MADPNEKARIWLRHLMEQLQQLVAKHWVTEQLLFASIPAMSHEQWEGLIKLFMSSPAMKANLEQSQKVIEASLKNFEDTIKLHELKQQVEQSAKEMEELEKQFVALVSKLPPPKFPN